MNNPAPGIPASTPGGPSRPSRRAFLRQCASGLVVWFVLRPEAGAQQSEATSAVAAGARAKGSTDFNAYLRIAEDGRVTCFTGKIEMGQGPVTSLPQMLAEELDVAVDAVDIVMGDTDLCPFDQGTWGSLTTRQFGPQLRAAAAEARAVLLEMAAERWQVPVAQLVVHDGVITDTRDPARRITYGELAGGKAINRHLAMPPVLKKPAEFKVAGQPLLRRDAREKVTGAAKYAGDFRMPGMLYASVLRPPAHGAKLVRVDASALANDQGVVFVQEPGLVAVLHELPDVAAEALARLKAEFEPSDSRLDDRNIYDHLAHNGPEARTVRHAGDLEAGRRQAVATVASTYRNAYVAHAAMETHTALAAIVDDRMTVWASTQNPFGARAEIAAALAWPVSRVRVITPYLGGGFGGKAFNLEAIEAARLAKATGRPVQVCWTREEEFFNDTFRPAAVVNVAAGLDAGGRISFWDFEVRFAGDRGAEVIYDVPACHIRSVGNFSGPPGYHPFAVGAWRAPGCNTNAFARESQVDQLAKRAGADPVDFRLRHLTDPRARRVLEAAAKDWGWQPAPPGSGR
ncbi:MAG TPA: molybdopterin cofactor-binding domain-containing protein, partial [Lacunisphaera sp.]|nr:molybdopterin cofactor-binding domain-containing protein [Lacunisphaera sp.]